MTVPVAAEVLVAVVYPVLVPVTLKVSVLPTCAAAGLNVVAVAPVMATPLAFHWYFRATGEGPQVPTVAVSVEPTLAVPLTAGVGAVRVPAATLAVAAEVLLTVAKSAFEPVTVTVRVLPTVAARGFVGASRGSRYADAVGVPLVLQRYRRRSPRRRVPRSAWNPTLAVPLMVGVGAVRAAAATLAVAADVLVSVV